ncbi:MAG: RecX family transcriptional regulator [Candidatus Stygibacter australis]|nr:RecX family transcriptional regulator [Candidatus Stygibacter australis]MDP8321211.1 RecX family transcriptional regulator [Candidatus Stygibacter australis]
MILLKIKQKNNRVFVIEFDDQIRGILTSKALRNLGLDNKIELEIDQDLADKINQEIISIVWNKFLNWLAFQERSIAQSRQYLLHLPFAADIVEVLIDKASKYNYLNDERFTRLLIESLIDRKKSLAEIKSKLYEKQIPSHLINTLLYEIYDQESQNKVLENLVEQLYFRWKLPDQKKRERKVCEYLAKRGFDYHEAKNIFYRIKDDPKNYDQYSD